MKTTLILAAAGKGERAGFQTNKLLVPFGGKTTLERTLDAFTKSGLIDEIFITASKGDFERIKSLAKNTATVVLGGATRTESVKNALAKVSDGIVLIHDGARPFLNNRIIKDCIDTATRFGSAVTAVPSSDTVCKADGINVLDYLGKSELYSVQTPQAFKLEEIKKAYENAGDKTFNDDGEVYKNTFGKVYLVKGDKNNVKLTYPEDFERLKGEFRFGVGFDCHKLVENRKLILGGIEIPHDKGLLGHSDADVITHAIMDAILSACALRDIGYHFPDNDQKYKDANSMLLLEEVLRIIAKNNFAVQSVSATVMAEKPKLLKIIPTITENLANALSLPLEKVGVSATTLEGLGFVGREEGICVHATAVVKSI